ACARVSYWKLAIKILVTADPYPNPNVAFKSLRDSPIVACHSHRPEARSAPARRADRNATVPVGAMDARDFAGIFCERCGLPLEGYEGAPNGVSRSQKFPWMSRTLFEVALLNFRKPVGVGSELSFDFVAQSR